MIGALCEHYHWEPSFWRTMGWRELRAWTHTLARSRARAQGTPSTHSWAGRDRDPFWQAMDRKRGRA